MRFEPLQLYWQPGCTSCLRAREFLEQHAVDFESYNVLADDAALSRLTALGLKSVPVLRRGARYVFAQDLDEVAAFVGVRLRRERLPATELAVRVTRFLDWAAVLTKLLPPECGSMKVPGRERTWFDLAFHIATVAEAFVDAARGQELSYAYYERTPPLAWGGGAELGEKIAAQLSATNAAFARWRDENSPVEALAQRPLQTYFGRKSLWVVLERTTWHVAQHCRQLEQFVVESAALETFTRLSPGWLQDLPLPNSVWDPEPTFDRNV